MGTQCPAPEAEPPGQGASSRDRGVRPRVPGAGRALTWRGKEGSGQAPDPGLVPGRVSTSPTCCALTRGLGVPRAALVFRRGPCHHSSLRTPSSVGYGRVQEIRINAVFVKYDAYVDL